MKKHIKYNGKSMTEEQLETLSSCNGVHQSLTELFECTSCRLLFEYQ